MNGNKMRNGRALSIPGGIVYGALAGFGWTMILSGILGWLIHKQYLQEAAVGYGSMVILLSASILAAMVSYGKIKRQRAASCFGAGGVYLLILVGITAFFFGGQYSGFGVTSMLILGGSGAAVFITMERQNRKTGKGCKIRI